MKFRKIILSFIILALSGMVSCSLAQSRKIEFIQSKDPNELQFSFEKKHWYGYDFSKLVIQCKIYKITNGNKVELREGIQPKWEFNDTGSFLTLKSDATLRTATTVEIFVYADDGAVLKKSSYLIKGN